MRKEHVKIVVSFLLILALPAFVIWFIFVGGTQILLWSMEHYEPQRHYIKEGFSDSLIVILRERYQVDVRNATFVCGYYFISAKNERTLCLFWEIPQARLDKIFLEGWTEAETVGELPTTLDSDLTISYVGKKNYSIGVAYYTAPDENGAVKVYFEGFYPPNEIAIDEEPLVFYIRTPEMYDSDHYMSEDIAVLPLNGMKPMQILRSTQC